MRPTQESCAEQTCSGGSLPACLHASSTRCAAAVTRFACAALRTVASTSCTIRTHHLQSSIEHVHLGVHHYLTYIHQSPPTASSHCESTKMSLSCNLACSSNTSRSARVLGNPFLTCSIACKDTGDLGLSPYEPHLRLLLAAAMQWPRATLHDRRRPLQSEAPEEARTPLALGTGWRPCRRAPRPWKTRTCLHMHSKHWCQQLLSPMLGMPCFTHALCKKRRQP